MTRFGKWLVQGLIDIDEPSDYGAVISLHLPYLALSAPFLIAARLIPIGMQVTPGCLFKRFTGFPCLFCGYTRAFQHIARLDLAAAAADNPAAVLLFVFMFAVALWNMAGLLAKKLLRPGPFLRPSNRKLFMLGIAGIFVLNWIYRIVNGGLCPVDFGF